MVKKLLIFLLILIFCTIIYFAYTVFTKRESDLIQKTPSKQEIPSATNIQRTTNTQQESNNTQDNIKEDATNTTTENTSEDQSFYVHVTPLDCTRECEPYKYNEKELKYCQNVCGFVAEDQENSNCDKLKDLSKDYCYKNQAIAKKDNAICDSISDTTIKKTCKNRIQEDVLENM